MKRALILAAAVVVAAAQQSTREQFRTAYVLGPDDQVVIRAMDADEISDKPVRIDPNGYIRLPLVGRLKPAGLTIEQFEAELAKKLKTYMKEPEVAVSVVEFRSQPVSVIGCVRNPGVLQLQGQKTLVEILSLAGGLTDEAGHSVKISRRLEWGRIPLASAADDATGGFSVAQVSLQDIMEARNPAENIMIRPQDVISVPRGEMVYVIGQVQRAGGYMLRERETLSVLQALSLAGGLDRASSPQNARILRLPQGGGTRTEIPVDMRKIIAGQAGDVPLQPDDILFVPSSAPKKAFSRAAEAAVQITTGLIIFRR
jgi:polysaccharide export outer membrane protein